MLAGSQVAVTHPRTDCPRCCLTSVIGRELVLQHWRWHIGGTWLDTYLHFSGSSLNCRILPLLWQDVRRSGCLAHGRQLPSRLRQDAPGLGRGPRALHKPVQDLGEDHQARGGYHGLGGHRGNLIWFTCSAISCSTLLLVVFSACCGICTGNGMPILTVYFPVLAYGILGKGSWHHH